MKLINLTRKLLEINVLNYYYDYLRINLRLNSMNESSKIFLEDSKWYIDIGSCIGASLTDQTQSQINQQILNNNQSILSKQISDKQVSFYDRSNKKSHSEDENNLKSLIRTMYLLNQRNKYKIEKFISNMHENNRKIDLIQNLINMIDFEITIEEQKKAIKRSSLKTDDEDSEYDNETIALFDDILKQTIDCDFEHGIENFNLHQNSNAQQFGTKDNYFYSQKQENNINELSLSESDISYVDTTSVCTRSVIKPPSEDQNFNLINQFSKPNSIAKEVDILVANRKLINCLEFNSQKSIFRSKINDIIKQGRNRINLTNYFENFKGITTIICNGLKKIKKIYQETNEMQEILEKGIINTKENFIKHKIKKYCIKDNTTKEKIVNYARTYNINKASQVYGVAVKNIKRWMMHGVVRKKGCGRKHIDRRIEMKLKQQINYIIGEDDVIKSYKIKFEDGLGDMCVGVSEGDVGSSSYSNPSVNNPGHPLASLNSLNSLGSVNTYESIEKETCSRSVSRSIQSNYETSEVINCVLLNSLRDEYCKNGKISYKGIRDLVKRIKYENPEFDCKKFICSNTWIRKFLKRNSIQMRLFK